MRVPVVNIRQVRMEMSERGMNMRMGMIRAGGCCVASSVLVHMMVIIVPVTVFMLLGQVAVFVTVRFAGEQQDADNQ